MGYVEETGVAQYLRDARITTIYEGTTAIQANDGSVKNLGRYAASWIAGWPKRPSSTAALT